MYDFLDILVFIAFLMPMALVFINKKRVRCTNPRCNGIMESFIYIGNGVSSTPDNIHLKCKKCGKQIQC